MANNLKEIHKQIIISKAIKLFIREGINNVTMTDIARDIGIGEATLYRYFGRKQNIVMLGAVSLWESLCDEYLVNHDGMTGLAKMESFYYAFLKAYKEKREYYSFIYEFDTLLVHEKIDKDLLLEYEKLLARLADIWIGYYNLGIRDCSLRGDLNPKIFYVTSTHSLLNLCKKLAMESTELKSDTTVKDEEEIELLIKMIIDYIKR